MSTSITICYIDDRNDPILSRYIDEFCNKYIEEENISKYELKSVDYTFQDTDNYKTLLSNDRINRANIIVIDSKLFENENSSLSKFTGEQFKIILRQVLPFIKTIVVSQNPASSDSLTIQKFQSAISGSNYKDYYDESLKPILIQNILQTVEEHEILSELAQENEVDSLLLGTIQSTILGIRDTALFEKDDLDELIKLFNEVKLRYEN